jgi:hypothetical protein
MHITCLYPRSGRLRWLLVSFILGSVLAASCSEAGQRPAAVDLTKVKITLHRSSCEGSCPVYTVTIHSDGRVVFAAAGYVLLPGTHEDRIDPENVAALFAQFQKAGFFNLRSEYALKDTDASAYVLTVDTGQRQKSVKDYLGEGASMPKAVTELENAVDTVAGTNRWLRGTAGLVAWLEGQNFDFQSPEAVELAVLGARGKADEAMVLAMIDRGVPLDSEVSIRKYDTPKPVVAGFDLMASAIRRGQVELFNRLAAAGWLDGMGREQAAQLFVKHGAGCSPALVDAVADAGIDIDAPEPPQGGTALAYVGGAAPCWDVREDHREEARIATARRLLARGADPNHRDRPGRTPLYYALGRPGMMNLLLAHGAERDCAGPGFKKWPQDAPRVPDCVWLHPATR